LRVRNQYYNGNWVVLILFWGHEGERRARHPSVGFCHGSGIGPKMRPDSTRFEKDRESSRRFGAIREGESGGSGGSDAVRVGCQLGRTAVVGPRSRDARAHSDWRRGWRPHDLGGFTAQPAHWHPIGQYPMTLDRMNSNVILM